MDFQNQDRDPDRLGETVQKIIDRAVSSQNYQKLNKTVRDTIDRAMDTGVDAIKYARNVRDAVNDTVRDAINTGAEAVKYARNVRDTGNDTVHDAFNTDTGAAEYARTARDKANDTGRDATNRANTRKKEVRLDDIPNKETAPTLYAQSKSSMVKGVIKCVFGYLLAGTAVIELFDINTPSGDDILFNLLFAAGGAALLFFGIKEITSIRRFRKYIQVLNGRLLCFLKDLAQAVKKPIDFVEKDVKKLIQNGYFTQGHIDESSKILIISDEAYQFYQQTVAEQKKKQQPPQQNADSVDSRVQDVLERGNSFLRKIRSCNDAIPGVEISQKIAHIETLVQRIFECAEAHPETVTELKKLMDYYLPMTIKLLDAYAEMDRQSIETENIQASKREIEDTLDTLDIAFKKLLDSMFENTAMDISSDISVLQAMLAQEGLTEDELHKNK